ncbi:MAG: hypothetical protein KGI73_00850 [Patescibacteria group bacterium]|nr:hypothetical protein [Patescibacteria group bacterium]
MTLHYTPLHSLRHRTERGQLVLIAFVFMSILLALSAVLASYTLLYSKSSSYMSAALQAHTIADAGIDEAVYSLNQNSSYTGESYHYFGEGAFESSVATIDATHKRVTVTAYVPAHFPVSTRTASVVVSIGTSVVSFHYGAQVGDGGVTMNNGSRIVGNLYSDGNVLGNGTITGDATVAGGTSSTPNQSWAVENTDVPVGNVTTNADVAESFVPSVSQTLNTVSLNLKKVGSPGDLTIKIVTDNNGQPGSAVLASGVVSASTVAGSYAFVNAALSSSPSLTAGHTYWIIAVATIDANNYFVWGSDSAGGYTAGALKNSANWTANNPVWNTLPGNADFKTWMGGVITSLSGVTVNGNVWAHAISNCSIGGNALYQTRSNCTVSGTGTVSGTDAPPAPLPVSAAEIASWEAAAAAGQVITHSYSLSGSDAATLGPAKIEGDLTLSNSAILYLAGPVWVEGNVSLANSAELLVSSSAGSSGIILIADNPGNSSGSGTITISNNSVIQGNGTSGSTPMLLSTNTGSSAISINNNGASAIFYAPYGGIFINNNAALNEVVGYSLTMSNNASVTYVSGFENQSFSNGPGGSWAVEPGTYTISE